MISIHALLAESDTNHDQATNTHRISIHALLAESDGKCPSSVILRDNFYPRSPCGERRYHRHRGEDDRQISIHALLAESDEAVCNQLLFDTLISIHALLAESDHWPHGPASRHSDFYPRSPCGERP